MDMARRSCSASPVPGGYLSEAQVVAREQIGMRAQKKEQAGD
jgi:hypothetical protein